MSEVEKKFEQPDKILKIVKEILDFNKHNTIGKGLKIRTANQMLSRLPITLAPLKTGNSSDKVKMKLGNCYIFCLDQRNLQNIFIKVWLTLFKNGNNLYEHWKQ